MSMYIVTALVNVGVGRFSGLRAEDQMAYVTAHAGDTDPIRFAVEANSTDAAFEAMFAIGNRMATDAEGREWPSDIRSLSVGDVVRLDLRELDTCARAVASVGFENVELNNPVVPIEGTNATSRTDGDGCP